ncbi:helix-turn-helix transcriptional regulator [Eggerthella lenta]
MPYVAEELVISKNTVRTHTKSIFAKTGVHSRQELIDLVESIEA